MTILGIETSCDETAAAVVEDGRNVLSGVLYTQIPLHQPYGGVVPEIASRAHIEKISGIAGEAIGKYREVRPGGGIDAVAVTYGPGLASSLIVGLAAAKGLAVALGRPLYCVNHIEAHLHAPFLADAGEEGVPLPEETMPALGLAVSGGHTLWTDMPEYGRYETIGQTLDDAAGEAFDKASKMLGLGYPGGPAIDRAAKAWFAAGGFAAAEPIPFPKGRPRPGVSALAGLDAEFCTSFSGLKTALMHYLRKTYGEEGRAPQEDIPRIAASYQEAVTDVLADRTMRALRRRDYRSLIVGGGVSLNGRLREKLSAVAKDAGVRLLMPKPKYCGDNAAMVAGLAFWHRDKTGEEALAADVMPTLPPGSGNPEPAATEGL